MTDGAPRVLLRSRLARINFVVLAFASVLVTACIALTSAWLAVQRQVDEAHLRLDLLREGQPPALVIADEAAAGRHFAALRSMPYLLAVDVFSGDGRLLASATPVPAKASAPRKRCSLMRKSSSRWRACCRLADSSRGGISTARIGR